MSTEWLGKYIVQRFCVTMIAKYESQGDSPKAFIIQVLPRIITEELDSAKRKSLNI